MRLAAVCFALISSQISTCAGFQAIILANTKLVRGNITTGVGAMACRHELWLPRALIDLQKGERCRPSLAHHASF